MLLTALNHACENDLERLTLHRLVNRNAFVGGNPSAPEVFGEDLG